MTVGQCEQHRRPIRPATTPLPDVPVRLEELFEDFVIAERYRLIEQATGPSAGALL
jgi:hypothetical protein